MKKVYILLIATLIIGMFASAASAKGFVGIGIGLQPSVTNQEDYNGMRIIGNVGADYSITDKITLDGNVFVMYYQEKDEKNNKVGDPVWGVHALLSGKYDLFKVGEGVIGPELTLMYTDKMLSNEDNVGKYDKSFSVRGGVFIDYPLSDVGSIYGSISTGLVNSTDFNKEEGTDYSAYKEFGAKVGLKFKVTEDFSIRTELDYSLASKSTLFSLKFGYNF